MSFEILHPEVQRALRKAGFEVPTEPQRVAIEKILEGKNVLLLAPTGSGKTEAAMLPVLSMMIERDSREISALYITPLRALNRDMFRRLKFWCDELGFSISVRHGDTPQSERRRQSERPPKILITTPETLQAILVNRKMRGHLRNIRWVIVDEIHELASSKRGSQLSIALERLHEISGDFQRIGLSATVGNPEEVAKLLFGTEREGEIINAFYEKPFEFRVILPERREEDVEASEMAGTTPEIASAIRIMKEIMERGRSTLIFVNTRQTAELLASRMRKLGIEVAVHHGSLSRTARIEVEEAFKRGEINAMICTSSMELGIDIGFVDSVIQFSSPREVSRLIQRAGRSGHRYSEVSRGFIIALTPDEVLESAVIARRALEKSAESIRIHEKPLDVLANQIASIVNEYGEIELQRLFRIVKRAYPFREIEMDELREVCEILEEASLIKMRGETLLRRRKLKVYSYENLSMIPDERRLDVLDISTRRVIGHLDESFAVTLKEGDAFITRGECWRVVRMGERIEVEPLHSEMAEIPNWTGEEIPVPFEVAEEVGELRKKVLSNFEEVLRNYPVEREALEAVERVLRRHLERDLEVPSNRDVVIENGDSAVINVCGGHRMNAALGWILSALLSSKLGGSVAMEVDPYRIILFPPKRVSKEEISEILKRISPESVESLLEIVLRNTTLFQWRFMHVARRFGLIRKDVEYGKMNFAPLIETYRGTPVYREVLREIFHERLDVERLKELLKNLGEGKIKIKCSPPLPLTATGYYGEFGIVIPQRSEISVLQAVKERIMNEKVILACLSCGKWSMRKRIGEIGDERCPLCGSKMITMLKRYEEEKLDVVRRREPREEFERLQTVAKILNVYGRKGAMVLAGRGIGPRSAVRILRKFFRDEHELLREIVREEKRFALYRQFWD
ncbi:MAG: ATP-dependent helicase Lhr and Lhr-like helicase [Archaeoglobi archaeon]|nr:ATP-dependent helicase Lhr and Lhr-like helicase [Archaeoglobi archaeon]MDK2781699.1 ATP-dependent helicase Lhr and Lhr-like helicase [Archaeoglobi archaeon]